MISRIDPIREIKNKYKNKYTHKKTKKCQLKTQRYRMEKEEVNNNKKKISSMTIQNTKPNKQRHTTCSTMAGKQNLVDSEADVFGRNITERDNKAKPRQTAPPLSR